MMEARRLPPAPFKVNCKDSSCAKLIEMVVVAWKWRPKLRRFDPIWHPFNLAVDIGAGAARNNGVSHYRTCPGAEKFGGADRAVSLPTGPVFRPLEPPPDPKSEAEEKQRTLF